MVVGDLFSRQCKPWVAIAQNLVELIHEAALSTFTKLLSEICDENTQSRLMKGVIQPSLYKLRQELQDQLSEFLEPHLSVHPITYNEHLVQYVQGMQSKRHKRRFDQMARDVCKEDTNTVTVGIKSVDLYRLLHSLVKATEPNVQEYSASLALDVSEAYYQVCQPFKKRKKTYSPPFNANRPCFQVALRKFVDDLSVNAVETVLIQRLPDV